MHHPSKKFIALLATGAVAVAAALAGPAGAQNANTIVVKGGTVFKPGKAIIDNMRFAPMSREVKSGKTLKIDNRTKAPHTLSIVKKSDLPKTAAQMEKFYESPLMGEFMQAHEVDPTNEDAPPGKLLVNVGPEGFDQPGDSQFFMEDVSIKVTAKKGTNLSYVCLLHPWMQGTLRVR
jgi:plastocyanin